MYRRDFLATVTAMGTITITGCQSSNNSTETDGEPSDETGASNRNKSPYKSVIRENVRALNNEDLELLKQTMHEDSPVYERTIEGTQRVWSEYDLTYELEQLEVTKPPERDSTAASLAMQVQQEGDCEETIEDQSFQVQQEDDCKTEAHVRFVQVTRKKSGPEFRDNRTEGRHILRPSGEDWKIWDTETIIVEYL